MNDIAIRESLSTDESALEDLYPSMFPEEDLLPLVRKLLKLQSKVISLVAISAENVVGHIVFTICGLVETPEAVALLGPLGVSPECQRSGIGSVLIEKGFERLQQEDMTQVQVLGDPSYYGRFGFKADSLISPPYTLPEDWKAGWQFTKLREDAPQLSGTLTVPEPWQERSLWLPPNDR